MVFGVEALKKEQLKHSQTIREMTQQKDKEVGDTFVLYVYYLCITYLSTYVVWNILLMLTVYLWMAILCGMRNGGSIIDIL